MEQEKKIVIKKILVTLGKQEVALTLDEAKRLKALLDDMFGKQTTQVEHVHHYNWFERWQPSYWLSVGGSTCDTGINNQVLCASGTAMSNVPAASQAVCYQAQSDAVALCALSDETIY